MFYHIFDNETQEYLHSGRNSTSKEEALISYLGYRFSDLRYEISQCFDIPLDTIDGMTMKGIYDILGEQWLIEDMDMASFILEECYYAIPDDESDMNNVMDYIDGVWKQPKDNSPATIYSADTPVKPIRSGLWLFTSADYSKFFLPF